MPSLHPMPKGRPRPSAVSLRRAVGTIALLATGLVGLAGCAMSHRYDMVRIHEASAARPARNPVIFIHGFLGAKLRDERTHASAWGRFIDAITFPRQDDLFLPIDAAELAGNRDHLIPYALYESVAGVKFYGGMLDALRTIGGYRIGDLADPHPDENGFVFVYDWRRDNVESARRLGADIAEAKRRLDDPGMRFDIVAHSMGGMVALYYLMYGTEDVVSDGQPHPVTWAGARDLGRVVLVGTPLRGTMASFRLLQRGFSRTLSPEAAFTMPSVYQLLPDAGESHFIGPEGTALDLDLYDAATWERQKWSVFALPGRNEGRGAEAEKNAHDEREKRLRFLQAALDRSRAFRAALQQRAPEGPPIPVHLFGSDCVPTLERAVVRPTAAGPVVQFDDEGTPDHAARKVERLIMAPGDGTVTASSLLGTTPVEDAEGAEPDTSRFRSSFFVCETHGMLPTNPAFQDNLLHVLLQGAARGVPGRKPAPVRALAAR
jgi:pimeloyl-ACP methyl ester carboxylesterase